LGCDSSFRKIETWNPVLEENNSSGSDSSFDSGSKIKTQFRLSFYLPELKPAILNLQTGYPLNTGQNVFNHEKEERERENTCKGLLF
jgi:hypothetical protein